MFYSIYYYKYDKLVLGLNILMVYYMYKSYK